MEIITLAVLVVLLFIILWIAESVHKDDLLEFVAYRRSLMVANSFNEPEYYKGEAKTPEELHLNYDNFNLILKVSDLYVVKLGEFKTMKKALKVYDAFRREFINNPFYTTRVDDEGYQVGALSFYKNIPDALVILDIQQKNRQYNAAVIPK